MSKSLLPSVVGGITIGGIGVGLGVITAPIGIGIGVLGVGTIVLETLLNIPKEKEKNLYNDIINSLGIKNKLDEKPIFIAKVEQENGNIIYRYTLPLGITKSDIEKHLEAFKIALNIENDIKLELNKNSFDILELKEQRSFYKFEEIKTKKDMELILGRAIEDEKIVKANIENEHVLLVGSTGSGKSTLLKAMLTNFLLNYKNIDLYLIDMKGGVELGLFKRVKQVKEFTYKKDEAIDILYKLKDICQDRYNLFEQLEVVDIREYNKKSNSKLNYILCVIEEFTQLTNEKEINKLLLECMPIFRAAGIITLMTIQRPSADVLNSSIKCHFNTIIGLSVNTKVNSEVAFDNQKLFYLKGNGHGILRNGKEEQEFQAFNINTGEIKERIRHLEVKKKSTVETPKEEKQELNIIDMLDNL